jgi:hypothetical protein
MPSIQGLKQINLTPLRFQIETGIANVFNEFLYRLVIGIDKGPGVDSR